ncbi:hypothetical protein RhiJN_22004 [Ceratobasidium sp. AG-Ba]|nr:hypothetical protein RhiJN_22004 [Ceratobasidium sp. AG-Ba]
MSAESPILMQQPEHSSSSATHSDSGSVVNVRHVRIGRALIKTGRYEREVPREQKPLPTPNSQTEPAPPVLGQSPPRRLFPFSIRRITRDFLRRNAPIGDNKTDTGSWVMRQVDMRNAYEPANQPIREEEPVAPEVPPTTRDVGEAQLPLSVDPVQPLIEEPERPTDNLPPVPPVSTEGMPPLQSVFTFHLYFLMHLFMQLAVFCFLYVVMFLLSSMGFRFTP